MFNFSANYLFLLSRKESRSCAVLLSLKRDTQSVYRLQGSKADHLASTNVIENPQSGVRRRRHNVSHWRDVDMVELWVASARLLTEKHFRCLDGHGDRWSLAAIPGRKTEAPSRRPANRLAGSRAPGSTTGLARRKPC